MAATRAAIHAMLGERLHHPTFHPSGGKTTQKIIG